LYSYLQCISQERKDKTRYVMKKDIKFTKLADVFNLTRQTISTKFKNLISLGLVVDSGVDTYDLIKLDNDVAWLV
jgi:predicted transcriptional regulator